MRWAVFIVVAIMTVVLETNSLLGLLSLSALGDITPSLVGTVVVFVSLFAPRSTALWAAWLLGLLLDFSIPAPAGTGVLVGPYALGYTLGAYLVLQLRTMVFRRKALTVGMLTFTCMVTAGVVVVALLTIRSWYPHAGDLSPMSELARRVGIAAYSGLLAVPLGWVLLQTLPLWSFQEKPSLGSRNR